MAAYLAMRIEMQKMNYTRIFTSKVLQKYQDEVDSILALDGYKIGDDGWAVKEAE